MRDTSLEAYKNTYMSGQAKHKRYKIYNFILKNQGYTRQRITDATGIPINIVCPRVFELLEAGLVFESGEKIKNQYRLYPITYMQNNMEN